MSHSELDRPNASDLTAARRGQSDFLVKLQDDLRKEVEQSTLDRTVTPLTLFSVLLKDEMVQGYIKSKGLDPEPLISHINVLVAATERGEIKERSFNFNFGGGDELVTEVIDRARDEARDEVKMRPLKRKDPSATQEFGYEPKLLEFISSHVAVRGMRREPANNVTLFAAALEKYKEVLGSEIGELEELLPEKKKKYKEFSFAEKVGERETVYEGRPAGGMGGDSRP